MANTIYASIVEIAPIPKFEISIKLHAVGPLIPDELVGTFYSQTITSAHDPININRYTLVIPNSDGTGAYVTVEAIFNGNFVGHQDQRHVFCSNCIVEAVFDLKLISNDPSFPRTEWAKTCRGATAQNFPIACETVVVCAPFPPGVCPVAFQGDHLLFLLLENRYTFAGMHFSRIKPWA
jgi:hypothetical protein